MEQKSEKPRKRWQQLLEGAKHEFLLKINFIDWEAAQWLQYSGSSYDEKSDLLTLSFKTSTYAIGFTITMKAFSTIYGKPFIPTDEAYAYFKQIKYNEHKHILKPWKKK